MRLVECHHIAYTNEHIRGRRAAQRTPLICGVQLVAPREGQEIARIVNANAITTAAQRAGLRAECNGRYLSLKSPQLLLSPQLDGFYAKTRALVLASDPPNQAGPLVLIDKLSDAKYDAPVADQLALAMYYNEHYWHVRVLGWGGGLGDVLLTTDAGQALSRAGYQQEHGGNRQLLVKPLSYLSPNTEAEARAIARIVMPYLRVRPGGKRSLVIEK